MKRPARDEDRRQQAPPFAIGRARSVIGAPVDERGVAVERSVAEQHGKKRQRVQAGEHRRGNQSRRARVQRLAKRPGRVDEGVEAEGRRVNDLFDEPLPLGGTGAPIHHVGAECKDEHEEEHGVPRLLNNRASALTSQGGVIAPHRLQTMVEGFRIRQAATGS